MMINRSYPLKYHDGMINDTDRTTTSLLFHENIIDVLGGFDKDRAVAFYGKFLDNMCFGLYRQNDVSKPNVDFQRDEFYNEDIQEQPPVSFGSYRIGYGYGDG
jgi:hypothetical protein